jgi:2-hydroxychromene-2-carboxylate isomerase
MNIEAPRETPRVPTIDFWCELASPYTYLSVCRIEALAARARVDVKWRPFSLHPIFRAVGWQTSPFEIYADKGRYMWRDMEREAERLRIPLRRPTVFPRNSVPAAKIALLGVEKDWGPVLIERVMHANFVEDRDIGSPAVLEPILDKLGLDGATIRQEATSPAQSSTLRRSTEEAISLRIFGAPTFMVGDEMFWGNDRLENALDWATRPSNAKYDP